MIKHHFFEKLGDCGEGPDRSVINFVCRFTLFVERVDIALFSFAGQSPNANKDWLVERLWLKQIYFLKIFGEEPSGSVYFLAFIFDKQPVTFSVVISIKAKSTRYDLPLVVIMLGWLSKSSSFFCILGFTKKSLSVSAVLE